MPKYEKNLFTFQDYSLTAAAPVISDNSETLPILAANKSSTTH